MTPPPRFIGYDSRALPEHLDGEWDDARRERFLLRPDIEHPLSVDTMVWPAMDDIQFPETHDEYGYGFLGLVAQPLPPDACSGVCIAIGVFPDSWSNEQRAAWDANVKSKEGREIGVEYLMGDAIAAPNTDTFTFVGFDVADPFLLSGLMNCGWNAETVAGDRRRWSPTLNEAHLFTDHDTAHEFARLSDTRIAEHAPFFAYGLWMRVD